MDSSRPGSSVQGILQEEYWSGLPFPSSRDLPDPGIKPMSPALAVQFSSVAQACPTLCDPMDCSTPGLPGCHQLPELAQTHVCQVGDAIQASHPLSSPLPPTSHLSQYEGIFQ